MTLHLLLPPKESFTDRHAGAIAKVARDSLANSRRKAKAVVFGRAIDAPPMAGLAYQPIETWHRFLHGRNIGFGKGYLAWLHRQPREAWPTLIEVHGRCALAERIAKALPEVPVVLFQHNDPRGMKGGETAADRARLAHHLAGVFSNSSYIEQCFRDGLSDADLAGCALRVTRLGVERITKTPPPKSRTVLFVGRMVPEKGALETAEAIAEVLPKFPDWRFRLIGARRFEDSPENDYARSVRAALEPLGHQVEMLGFLPSAAVRQHQADAAITLAPSQWQEPAGLVVLEALAAGSALITTRRGGIPEYAENRALLLDDADSRAIAQALEALLADPARRAALQATAWSDYPFSLEAMAAAIDAARAEVMTNHA